MTKEEAKALLEKLGMKVDEVSDELDTETRRAVRPYWITISVITFVLGCGVGHLFF